MCFTHLCTHFVCATSVAHACSGTIGKLKTYLKRRPWSIEYILNIARSCYKLGASVWVSSSFSDHSGAQPCLWHVLWRSVRALPLIWPATAGLRLKLPPGSSRQGRLRTPAAVTAADLCRSVPLRSTRLAAAPPLHSYGEGAAEWRHISTVHTTFGPLGERASWAPSWSQRRATQSSAAQRNNQMCIYRLRSFVCARTRATWRNIIQSTISYGASVQQMW